jgi:Tfp pilus assembly protein PilP
MAQKIYCIGAFLSIMLLTSSVHAVQQEWDNSSRIFQGFAQERPDPFYPFLSQNKDEIFIDPKVKLEGLRTIELGQSRLVAIMSTSQGHIAMAEDTTGKGYTLHEGVEIGRFGRIERIEEGLIIVREIAPTRAGRIFDKQTIMSLRKEGER